MRNIMVLPNSTPVGDPKLRRIPLRLFTEHPATVGETYSQHFVHAMSFSVTMFLGSLACLVHALLPFLFLKTGSNAIIRLHDRMVVNRDKLTPPRGEKTALHPEQA